MNCTADQRDCPNPKQIKRNLEPQIRNAIHIVFFSGDDFETETDRFRAMRFSLWDTIKFYKSQLPGSPFSSLLVHLIFLEVFILVDFEHKLGSRMR